MGLGLVWDGSTRSTGLEKATPVDSPMALPLQVNAGRTSPVGYGSAFKSQESAKMAPRLVTVVRDSLHSSVQRRDVFVRRTTLVLSFRQLLHGEYQCLEQVARGEL